MSTTRTIREPSGRRRISMRSVARSPHGPVIVAADGMESSLGGLDVAKLLAAGGSAIHLVSVIEPATCVDPPADAMPGRPGKNWSQEFQRLDFVREQARGIIGPSRGVSAESRIGHPVEVISRAARDRQAELVVTGRRRHPRIDRLLFLDETPLGVARATGRPVLAVPGRFTSPPRRVLVAAGPDRATIAAARVAGPLLANAEVVHVVHVAEPTDGGGDHGQSREARGAGIVAALELPATTRVEVVSLTGRPIETLLAFAASERVDLIVAGYHPRRLMHRVLGRRSVAEGVFRRATCAMLLIPFLETEGE